MDWKIFLAAAVLFCACEIIENEKEEEVEQETLSLKEVAELLGELPIGSSQAGEVRDAVNSSRGNGFDEEYLLKDLFESPGKGVGDDPAHTKASSYDNPLRDMIRSALENKSATKAGAGIDVDGYLNALKKSDIQIYWPYSENWDGDRMPIITYAPDDPLVETNVGYRLVDGKVEALVVDEKMAQERPVWVINRNDDSEGTPLEMLRKSDPQWGQGGEIVIGTKAVGQRASKNDTGVKTLILKDFTMKRNYDCWFRGASEFFVKAGAVENFKAKNEEDLSLYSPSITDFMIVVKRKYVGVPVPFNAVLVSEWTDQLSNIAFMVIEDDGGTQETWKASATVKYNSKSYGFDVSLPFHSKDDIVWRGQLSSKYITGYNNTVGHFGDVDLTFEIVDCPSGD